MISINIIFIKNTDHNVFQRYFAHCFGLRSCDVREKKKNG